MTKKEDTPEYTIHYHFVAEEPVEEDDYDETDISQRTPDRFPDRFRRPPYYRPRPPYRGRRRFPPRRRYFPPTYGYGCPAGTTPYYVRYGDTVWGIAQEFGIDIDDIVAANPGVDLDNLDVGERLCIPR